MAKKFKHLENFVLPQIPGVTLHETPDTQEEWRPPKPNQAERIIAKFGGVKELHAIFRELNCERTIQTIYKWTKPKGKSQGTGGFIPPKDWNDLWRAARYAGVVITSEDMDPREDPPLARTPRTRDYKRGQNGPKRKRRS